MWHYDVTMKLSTVEFAQVATSRGTEKVATWANWRLRQTTDQYAWAYTDFRSASYLH